MPDSDSDKIRRIAREMKAAHGQQNGTGKLWATIVGIVVLVAQAATVLYGEVKVNAEAIKNTREVVRDVKKSLDGINAKLDRLIERD